MEFRPVIKTAIPKHRYQIGDFSASVLGDIESGDQRRYRYIMAMVPMGSAEPTLYVCCEHAPPARASEGRYDIRVVNDAMGEIVDSADHWGDLEIFSEQAIDLAKQILGLRNEQVVKLS
ncbi:MAG: hypothetical protein K9L70_03585 [Thiohalocapsa sp.]|nr:hypothetical protein [Thiohalocapsa sp.]MCF7990369.1 hypothetical protein [Thiohalocapsa sp.]